MSSPVFMSLAALLVGVVLLPTLGFLTLDSLRRKSGTATLLLVGLFVLFMGERVFGEGSMRLPVSGLGLLIVLGAVGLRAYVWRLSTGGRREGHQLGLLWSGVAAGSLVLYALTLPSVTSMMGLSEEAVARWSGAWRSLFPIVTLLGLLPALRLDQILAVHPVVMPAGAARSAQIQGITGALAISLMFPLNYLVKQHDHEWDVAYFRTTRPGESTIAMAKTLTDPVEAILFYPHGSDVANQLEPYFDQLAAASDGRLTVRIVDQAFEPKLAEELKIRDNGQIVLKMGDANEKLKVDNDLDKAKRDLRKLDGLVQKSLIKLTRGQRTAYFLVGHGEANWRDDEESGRFRKIQVFKKEVLEAQNFKVKTLGVADGSTSAVPDDADLVVVAAPQTELFPDETAALNAYFDRGGSLLVLVDPKGDPMTDLLAHIGVEAGHAPLANAESHIALQGPPADNVLLATNKYGSHPSVKTLSRNSQALPVVLPDAASVAAKGGDGVKVTTLIRSMPNTWSDDNGNYVNDPDEQKKVFELAVAVTATPKTDDAAPAPAPEADDKDKDGKDKDAKEPAAESRAIVVGTQAYLSDVPLTRVQGNAVFAVDATRWLVHDEEVAGEINNEEDVKIQHTREEDQLWFWLAIAGVPAVVLGVGVMFIRFRRKS